MKDIHYILLAEIVQKYSVLELPKKSIYFKHPSLKDSFREALGRKEFLKEAEMIGLKSREELLNVAYQSGRWTKEKDALLDDLEFAINSRNKVLKKIEDNNMKKEILSQIERDSTELNALSKEKRALTSASKEVFIEQKLIKKSFSSRLFYDLDFLEPIDIEDLNACYNQYIEKVVSLSDRDNLLWVSFIPDFIDLFIFNTDVSCIFDEKGINLTIFQKNVLSYGSLLVTKLRNSYNMPDSIRNNPIKIYEWSEGSSKSKSVDDSDFNIREKVKKSGGLEKMKPEDKLT